MMRFTRILSGACLVLCLLAHAQDAKKAGLLDATEVKKLAPGVYYFAGQSAPVQLRNSAAFRTSGGKMVLAGFVDTSGYSSDIQQKYQGFFITEIKLKVEDADIAPGEYGFGFMKDGKFIVMDVGANDLTSVSYKNDDKLGRPVPLKMTEDNGSYRLYAGRKFVTLTPE